MPWTMHLYNPFYERATGAVNVSVVSPRQVVSGYVDGAQSCNRYVTDTTIAASMCLPQISTETISFHSCRTGSLCKFSIFCWWWLQCWAPS